MYTAALPPANPSCMQDMFKYIGRYTPAPLEPLPMKLMPFIPEYIPAVGGSDEFIKVPRPDGQPDYLGLKVRQGCAAVFAISCHCVNVCAWNGAEPGSCCCVVA
jgi:hypothetical protein